MFAVICGVAAECSWRSGNLEEMVLEIILQAEVRCWSVFECPPMRTMFPFMDHHAVEMWTCERVECLRALFMVLQSV